MIDIIDDFFENPHEIREIGLSLIENKSDCILNDDCIYYPGVRTNCSSEITNYIKNTIEIRLNKKITNILSSFHITSNIHSCGLIHHDPADYAALIYLNLNPPEHSGTAFYNISSGEFAPDAQNYNKSTTTKNIEEIESFTSYKKNYNQKYFDVHRIVDNQFNRFVLYSGRQYHAPQNYFGNNLFNSRLIIISAWDSLQAVH